MTTVKLKSSFLEYLNALCYWVLRRNKHVDSLTIELTFDTEQSVEWPHLAYGWLSVVGINDGTNSATNCMEKTRMRRHRPSSVSCSAVHPSICQPIADVASTACRLVKSRRRRKARSDWRLVLLALPLLPLLLLLTLMQQEVHHRAVS